MVRCLLTRPSKAALASALIAVVVGYHAVRNRHELRTLAWALTGRPKGEADPTSCNGDEVVAYLRRRG